MASFPVRTFLRIIFFILNGIVVVGLLLASAAPLLPPSSFSLAAFCGLLFEPLFWTNIICALLWLFTHHKRYSLFSLCAAALAIVPFRITYSHSFRQLPGDETAQHSLTLLTYNTHQCQNAKKTPQNDVLQYVKESGADIVFLQEYEVRKAGNALTFAEAKDFLAEVYPYTYFDFSIYNNRRQYGLAVFSRYPLENKRTIRYESRANISDLCDVIVGADTFRLFNNHLESNRFTSNDFEGLTDERPTGSSIWRSFERLTSKMRAAYSSRAEEVKRVQEEIAASPYPVIIAGDMNDVPVSYTYRSLRHARRGVQDCFLAGSRLSSGHTYRFGDKQLSRILGVRIDYLFVSPSFRVRQCHVGSVTYSDHLPLSAVVEY